MNCIWRCTCGHGEEGTTVGMRKMKDHAKEVHDSNPTKDIIGIWDMDDEEYLHMGWGVSVFGMAVRRGWFENPKKDEGTSSNQGGTSQSDGKVVEFVVEKKARGKGGSKNSAATANMGKAYVTMSNVPLHGSVQVFFALSRLMHPEAYPDDSPETMGTWIGHCVDVAMEVNGMGLSNLVAAERGLFEGEGDEIVGSESTDGELE